MVSDSMGEQRVFPLDFTPQCPHLRWLIDHLDGWQFGEQGLLDAIMAALELTSGWCIEYGAGDGVSLPLTIDRICKRDPSLCVMVEIDPVRRDSLKTLYPDAGLFSTFDWNSKYLEVIDIVVIDIDGSDSVVMREMFDAGVRPTLLVVEHMDRHFPIATSNPDPIPTWMLGLKLSSEHAIQDTAETLHWMALKYGYERIGLNRCNSFFVRGNLFPLLFR